MRALIIGLGGVGQRHIRNLKKICPSVKIFAVRQSNNNFEIDNNLKVDHSVDIIQKYGVHSLSTLEEAVEYKPDIAIIANPSALHATAAKFFVQTGIPIFVEKPIVCRKQDLDELIKLQSDFKTPIMVGYQLRFHPCVQQLKKLLDEKVLGPIQSVEVTVHSHMPSWHDYKDPKVFYAGNKKLGGGVVLTEIHEVDLLSWFFGLPKRVIAFGGTLGPLDLNVEDTVGALLEYQNEKRCFPATLTLSFVQRPPCRRFVVNGREGRIILEIPKLKLALEDTNGDLKEEFCLDSDFDRNSIFLNELHHFLDCLNSDMEPLTSLRNIKAGQIAGMAILDSLGQGTPVSCWQY